MKVACIQMRAGSVYEYKETHARILGLVRQAGDNKADMVVLPECAYSAYFLGLDLDKAREALALNHSLMDGLAELAVKYDMYIAAGLVTERNGTLYNTARMIAPDGTVINEADKSNMWHFDSKWFAASDSYSGFETRYGTMGMIVCADGRLPEISRILALEGAAVIVDLVNLAAAASDPKMLSNQQYQFILPTRAAENGVWMLVADKVGLEGGCASYLGRSMVINPDGDIVACASTDQEETIYYDVDPALGGKGAAIPRQPALYSRIDQPNEALPAARDVDAPVVMKNSEVFTSTCQFSAATVEEYIAKAERFIFCCDQASSRLVVLPPCEFPVDTLVSRLVPATPDNLLVVVTGRDSAGVRTAALFTNEGLRDTWKKTHSADGREPLSNDPFHCAETTCGKLAVVFDEEPFVPEVPRCYMLEGCNILLWVDSQARPMNPKTMQTRCAENKIFMVRSTCDPDDSACIVDTEGRVATATFHGVEQAASGMILYPLSLSKTVVPGTDVLFGRKNASYERLTR